MRTIQQGIPGAFSFSEVPYSKDSRYGRAWNLNSWYFMFIRFPRCGSPGETRVNYEISTGSGHCWKAGQ